MGFFGGIIDFNRIHLDSLNEFMALQKYENFEFRLLEKTPVFLQMNEKSVALLAFPDMKNSIDYLGFEATDENSLNRCRNLFDYYWERSKPFISAM